MDNSKTLVQLDGSSFECLSPDPLGVLSEEHALQNELCDLLEAIADKLPHHFDTQLVSVAISLLEAGLPRHMQLEEEAFFPLLRERLPEAHPLYAVLQCLEHEHDRDEATLIEICDALRDAVEVATPANPDMLGYMLRGFFESQRRHIAWEETVILPVARQTFTSTDLKSLQHWLMKSNHPRCCRQSILTLRKAREGANVCSDCANSQPTQTEAREPELLSSVSRDKLKPR